MLVLPIWSAVGFLVYFVYSRGNSHLGKGIVEVPEPDAISSRGTRVDDPALSLIAFPARADPRPMTEPSSGTS